MAEHCRLLLHGSVLWRQDVHNSSLLTHLTSWNAAVCFLHLQTRHSDHPPHSKFSRCSVISAFDYNIPSFQGWSSKHLQDSNAERHCNLIPDLFLGFKSHKWNHLILPSRFQTWKTLRR